MVQKLQFHGVKKGGGLKMQKKKHPAFLNIRKRRTSLPLTIFSAWFRRTLLRPRWLPLSRPRFPSPLPKFPSPRPHFPLPPLGAWPCSWTTVVWFAEMLINRINELIFLLKDFAYSNKNLPIIAPAVVWAPAP